MEIKQIELISFSPTGTTLRVLEHLAAQFPVPCHKHDCTPFSGREPLPRIPRESLLLVGAPVYGGRIPATFRERLAGLHGDGGPAVLAVTFGCREYDDALLELRDIVESAGFSVAAAAAFATEHNIVREIGAGRPNEDDFAAIARFAFHAAAKLRTAQLPLPSLAVVGDPEYREYSVLPLKPHASSDCTGCGACAAQCPVGAIPAGDSRKTEKKLCISCMRCTRVCPNGARALPAVEAFAAAKMLAPKCRSDKEHQTFL